MCAMENAQTRLRTYIRDQSRPALPVASEPHQSPTKGWCVRCCSLASSSSSVDIEESVIPAERLPLPQVNQRLLWAIFNKKDQDIEHYIVKVPMGDINLVDKRGWAPLHYAVQMRYTLAVIKLLERKDIDRNCVTDLGLTPTTILITMHTYYKHEGRDDCTYLIDQLGIDPDFVDSLLDVNSNSDT